MFYLVDAHVVACDELEWGAHVGWLGVPIRHDLRSSSFRQPFLVAARLEVICICETSVQIS